MTDQNDKKLEIIHTLKEKSQLKQIVYDNTFQAFSAAKDVLKGMAKEINSNLAGTDSRIRLEYADRSNFDAQLKVAGDVLLFSMHSNIFQFDREHPAWKTAYIQKNKFNAYSGIINIYNFLADSFRYSRLDDLGYLIARIFINHEKQYFVEGKRQMGMLFTNYGSEEISKQSLEIIISTAVNYALDFDLLVPPYDTVKIATVGQAEAKIQHSRVITGKRLGFQFNSDDVLISNSHET
ncbi:MAG: hypothetical protein A2X05_07865 [Bacteroidetes bacterium GWE2_41_25]|nr:MAG: hypothetical protein A2X03_02380 [Bacteroidetes bacterium GWA2_40_15]OFX94811.1 MAG: hypothetical protein A2X06_17080 [Bacteroidetes bacterium GWC2_40_22]OFY00464.1 MAG: hypothetical protein A2X05_07865 [Bacteroidetes bacterium GWE2_41_25]OFY60916.1 MAG: hypothetical protein A2X04_09485 [Bacteroidetes bacterium GWF2_41_9]HAM10004.1 hypothetical protein [Bacteroidales bacterium]